MVPVIHPRLPEAARAVRLSRIMELSGSEKTAAEKVAIDQEVFDFARMFAPDAEGLEKTATGLVRLADSLCNFEKRASLSASDANTLAAIGVIEDSLANETSKLAQQARLLNRGYGVAVMCDLLTKEAFHPEIGYFGPIGGGIVGAIGAPEGQRLRGATGGAVGAMGGGTLGGLTLYGLARLLKTDPVVAMRLTEAGGTLGALAGAILGHKMLLKNDEAE